MTKYLILPLALFAVSCGSNDDEVASGTFDDGDGGKASYSVKGDDGDSEVTIKTDKGEVRISSGDKAKDSLPMGLKLYPGAEIQSSMTGSGEGTSGAMVTFKTDADKEKVIDFYKDQVKSKGLDVKAEVNTGAMTMISAANKDGEGGVNVSAADDGSGGTQVTVIAGGNG